MIQCTFNTSELKIIMNKLSINPQCYLELNLPTISGNKGKKSTEIIGASIGGRS